MMHFIFCFLRQKRQKQAFLSVLGLFCPQCPQKISVCPQSIWGQIYCLITNTYIIIFHLSPVSPLFYVDTVKYAWVKNQKQCPNHHADVIQTTATDRPNFFSRLSPPKVFRSSKFFIRYKILISLKVFRAQTFKFFLGSPQQTPVREIQASPSL
jgi:hypothetical protein